MSLALDLVEEFRHGLVDVLTINLLTRGSLRDDDFVTDPEGRTILTDAALKRYFTMYEEKLTDAVTSARSGQPATWRGLLHEQAECLRDAILHGGDYQPFVVK